MTREQMEAALAIPTDVVLWAKPNKDLIFGMTHNAIRSREMRDLAGELHEGDPCAELAELLENAARELRSIAAHTHEWNDDSYCVHCGADGRA